MLAEVYTCGIVWQAAKETTSPPRLMWWEVGEADMMWASQLGFTSPLIPFPGFLGDFKSPAGGET